MAGIVQFENVGLREGTGAETLSDLSFTLVKGSFHLLLGPCSAGKSALLRLITGEAKPSRGCIRLFGDDRAAVRPSAAPALRRRIGLIHGEGRLLSHLTVGDNVALALRLRGAAENEVKARVGEMLDWIGLSALTSTSAGHLCAADRQRVAIARAVIGAPELILADEPGAMLDFEQSARLADLLAALHRNGATVLLATHDLRLLNRLPEAEAMRLNRGRLEDPVGALRYPPGRLARA